jgi:predicted Rossmann fold flavoprotein
VESIPQPLDLVVVGGGAAGFFAAITCAEQILQSSHNPPGKPPRILILEKMNRPLGKVLLSGGGRCNLTYACFDPAELVGYYPRGNKTLRSAFSRFQPADTIAWFEAHEVALKTEPDGRVFPVSDSSQKVVDCLIETARRAGVNMITGAVVQSIEAIDPSLSSTSQIPNLNRLNGFQVILNTSRHALDSDNPYSNQLFTRRILLATGGDSASLRLANALGQTIISPVPSLFTFAISDSRLKGLAGISVPQVSLKLLSKDDDNQISVKQHETKTIRSNLRLEQQGAVLITHWGLSGPAVLRLSAWGARWLYDHSYQVQLIINWMHPNKTTQVYETLKLYRSSKDIVECGNNSCRKVSSSDPMQRLPQRLWQLLVQAAGIDEFTTWNNFSNLALKRLVDELTSSRFLIHGKGSFKEEFVTCGGVSLDEVDFKTMESRKVPGLFFAGEVLDIDGLTGGFNLQNAWTTGWIAGTTIAKSIQMENKLSQTG